MKLEWHLGILNSQSSEYLQGFKERLTAEWHAATIGRETIHMINEILDCRDKWTEVKQCLWVCGWACWKDCVNLH